MMAPGTTAPLGSMTVPLSVAVAVCADAAKGKAQRAKSVSIASRSDRIRCKRVIAFILSENDSADYAMRGSNHHSYRARATRAAKASAEFNERQNCGELIADEAAPDETEKAERITESFVEANSKRRSAARTSEASSWISATLSVPPSDALGKKIGRNSPRIICDWL